MRAMGLARTIRIRTQEQAALYNLPIGSARFAGRRVAIALLPGARDIPPQAMVHVKPSSPRARVLQGTNDYHEEFHLRGATVRGPPARLPQASVPYMPLSAPFYAPSSRICGASAH